MDRWSGRQKDGRTDGQTEGWTGVGEGRGGEERRGENPLHIMMT